MLTKILYKEHVENQSDKINGSFMFKVNFGEFVLFQNSNYI